MASLPVHDSTIVPRKATELQVAKATDLLLGIHAIGKLIRQVEMSDAAKPIYRGSSRSTAG